MQGLNRTTDCTASVPTELQQLLQVPTYIDYLSLNNIKFLFGIALAIVVMCNAFAFLPRERTSGIPFGIASLAAFTLFLVPNVLLAIVYYKVHRLGPGVDRTTGSAFWPGIIISLLVMFWSMTILSMRRDATAEVKAG